MDLDRRARRSLALVVAWMLACALAFWAVYHLTVRTSAGRLVADASLRGAVLGRTRTEGLVDNALGVVTVASLLAALVLVVLVALVRLRRWLGLMAAALLIMANLSAQLLKEVVLERPDLGLSEFAPATLNSLPSGHSTAAFSVGVALLLVVPPRLRGAVALAAGAYSCVVAVATMFAGWHRASDSVASFLLVGFWAGAALLGVLLLDAAESPREPPSEGTRRRRRSLVTAATLALGVAAGLIGVLVVVDALRVSTLGQVTAFSAGVLSVLGTVAIVLVALLALVERTAPLDHPPTVAA